MLVTLKVKGFNFLCDLLICIVKTHGNIESICFISVIKKSKRLLMSSVLQ